MKRDKIDTDYAYKMGKASALNGPNTINCSFRIFSTPELRKAWERGLKDGEKEKAGK